MSKKWYPVINDDTCINCGACLAKCSHGVFKAGTNSPKVVFPEGCIDGCHGCQKLCPTDSIDYIGEASIEPSCSCTCNS